MYMVVSTEMHSDWFHRVEIVQGRWQHREEVGYWYPCRLEKTIFKWDIHIPLVMKGPILPPDEEHNSA
jgi:hypothetical protein